MDSATPSEPKPSTGVPEQDMPEQRPPSGADTLGAEVPEADIAGANTPAADTTSPPGAEDMPQTKRGRLRRILPIALLAAAVIGLGATATGFILYDEATKPDRSAPDVVVDNYLRAALRDRDDTQARLYACDNTQALTEIQTFREDIEQREEQFATRISVTWGSLAVEPVGRNRATVTVRTSRTVAGGTESDSQTWRFDVLDADGWRVCGAAQQD